MVTRRQVIATAAALPAARAFAWVPDNPEPKKVADAALQAALKGGATYADVRLVRKRRQWLGMRDEHLTGLDDSESYGLGVRVMKRGTWGFFATPEVTPQAARRAAERALAIAEANAPLQTRPLQLAPEPPHKDSWQTPIEKDPFRVPLDAKIRLLAESSKAAHAVSPLVKLVRGFLQSNVEEKRFFSTEGSDIEQMLYRIEGGYTVTAVDKGFESRDARAPAMSAGFEHLEKVGLVEQAAGIARDALEKLKADKPKPGARDLILDPSHLWLTIHESIGHSTELDRVLGYEANFAGTSFATVDQLGKLRYGGKIANFYADRTTPGGLATCGYDDDGVATSRFDLIKDGILVGYQTVRDQAGLPGFTGSRGCSYADSWRSVPFQRMPNVSLAPGNAPLTVEQLIASTDSGILILGTGSYSIDHQRKNFQFGGDMFYEIEKGKVARPLRRVAYQGTTTEFWSAMDAVCDGTQWRLNGAMSDGKGEPIQLNPVSHGCAPARFRGVRVLDASEGATS